jgi:hypothetical protein
MSYPVSTAYSAAYELRALALDRLKKSLPECGSLPVPVTRLLVDQYLLSSTIRRTTLRGKIEAIDLSDNHSEFEEEESASSIIYNDYSFVVAPAYKAYEGFLLFLARIFKLPVEEYKHNIGGLYDWEVNKKHKEAILEALENKLGSDKEGKDRWRELNMVLRQYRHNPAHFSGDKIETFEQAEDYVRMIINTINQMTKYLMEKKVVYENYPEIEKICEIG